VVALAPFFAGYEIEALLGRGGMGAVYRARQLSLGRVVAIKLLPFDLGVREDFAERFRREAAALARLSHPHIVAVHDFGQADDGHFFIVMEFMAGGDLATRLRESGPLPPAEALRVVRDVCGALECAHAQGVVHRDIKPANILLDAAGRVKVTDFGLAQLASDEPREALTRTGTLLGTPDYVAPEQLEPHGAVDRRADVFSVGVMLYELLAGRVPRGVFRPVSELAPVARELDRVLMRALQSEPSRRYAGVIELHAELVKADPLRRRRCRLACAAVLALLVAGAAVWAWRAWRPAVPLDVPVAFENSLGMRLVPAGTAGVLFSTRETSVGQFEAYAKAREIYAGRGLWWTYSGTRDGWKQEPHSWREPGFPQTLKHPVVGVTWHEAVDFCAWLTERERVSGRIAAADSYRLPTDAEWSVAAGLKVDAPDPAGVYAWGADFPPPPMAGNFAGGELREDTRFAELPVIDGWQDGHRFTAPAGAFTANAHGLHDIAGNVWEWVASAEDRHATLRGGSWADSTAPQLDAGVRIRHEKQMRVFSFGFRVVLERGAAK
jgi:hypothetical protein